MVLMGLFYALLVGALLVGQFRVVRRAVRHQKAGLGRYTYAKAEAPIGFWIVLMLEIVCLLAVSIYFAGALVVVVQ